MRLPLAFFALLAATPALADQTTGTILAYDREANVIVFNDRSVWELGDLEVPDDLEAGERVTIDFTSAGDSGIGKANAVTRE
ncbi:hypothetical protein [uncultured Jannaschia sp.]|uniref:hypothetical protein n=1 Tax=uncultured Jannaschia sp. TaxID=293347 RepID=UPI00260FB714|nr:hypothetical protein [uncultured Jannaschia sp.]